MAIFLDFMTTVMSYERIRKKKLGPAKSDGRQGRKIRHAGA